MSVTVLSGPAGGLIVRMENDVTGEVMADLLTRDAAEALIEQASVTLRCAPLDPNAGKAASFSHWTSIHAAGSAPSATSGSSAGPVTSASTATEAPAPAPARSLSVPTWLTRRWCSASAATATAPPRA
jgi:hypothetical protein